MKTPEDNDAELAGRVLREGSEPAFRALYGRHTPALYLFVLRLLGCVEREAEDVVQDTGSARSSRGDGRGGPGW